MEKTLILLRGVSGSGKSTLAKYFTLTMQNAVAVAADDYFIKDNEYNFNPANIKKAHDYCFKKTEEFLNTENVETIFVHNTSVNSSDVKVYEDLAKEYKANFVSLIVENRHDNENIHNVPEKTIQSQGLRLLNNIKVAKDLQYVASFKKKNHNNKILAIEYLKKYSDIKEGLKCLKEEFNINSKEFDERILLKYDIGANKNELIVRQCRGLIFDKKTFKIISLPFEKFGNYGESYADNNIDFSKAKIIEKLDGSSAILYNYLGKWKVQTLGMIEAEKLYKAGIKVGLIYFG